jgi:hypothetical protein
MKISREADLPPAGAIGLACGERQSEGHPTQAEPAIFLPAQSEPPRPINGGRMAAKAHPQSANASNLVS